MAVSKRLRYEVLRRDNHACKYCGAAAPDVTLTVDHVIPVTLGGSDDPSNLVAACKDCNAGKTSSPSDAALVADVDARAVRWSQAMQLAIEKRTADLAADRQRTDAFDTAWSSWTADGGPIPREANWRNSVLRFLAGGLSDQFLLDAVQTAMGNSRVRASETWRYFCGICWREMDHLRELAAGFADQADVGIATSTATPPSSSLPDLPFMDLFDAFLDEIVDALGGNEDARRLANRALWGCFPHAAGTHMQAWQSADPSVDEDEREYAAFEAARVSLSEHAAYFMYHIGQARRSQEVTT